MAGWLIIGIVTVASMIIVIIMIVVASMIIIIIFFFFFRLPWLRRLRAPSIPFVIVLAACGARA